jgi:hypothetical protein
MPKLPTLRNSSRGEFAHPLPSTVIFFCQAHVSVVRSKKITDVVEEGLKVEDEEGVLFCFFVFVLSSKRSV